MSTVTIDSKTNVPLFAVMGMVPVIVGGLLWLTHIDSKATTASEKAVVANEEIKDVKVLVLDVRERLIRIEEHQKKAK